MIARVDSIVAALRAAPAEHVALVEDLLERPLLAQVARTLARLGNADLELVGVVASLLPLDSLRRELRQADARHVEQGGAGASQRPADGPELVTKAAVLRALEMLRRTTT